MAQGSGDDVGVEAVDDQTLRITLAGPSPTFLQKMVLVHVFPVREDLIAQFGVGWTEAGNYIGNGPFVMTEWVHQDHITLEANSAYWGARPSLDKITLKMIGDPNAELAGYRNNELEISRVPPGTESATLSDATLGQEVVRILDLSSVALFLNNATPPFNNQKVRQAFSAAIDRDAWIDQVINGVGRAATSWLPPELPGHGPNLGSEYGFNPDLARRLLAEAGYPDGAGFPSVTFSFPNVGGEQIIAEFVQAQIKSNLGVDMNLEPLDQQAFFGKVLGARQFDMISLTWTADYPDPENFLANLFISEAGQNFIGYSNPEFDGLAIMASAELDQQKRLELWASAHEVLVQDTPMVFFFFQERFFLKKPSVRGLILTGIDGAIPGDTMLAGVSIAP